MLIERLLKVALLGSEWVLYLLVGLSVLSLATMVERWVFFVRHRQDLDRLRRELTDRLDAGEVREAYALLEQGRSFEARLAFEALRWAYAGPDAIADALHHPLLARYKFLVVGHTDATGSADYNLKLSLQRAEAIRAALTTTFTVAPKRLFAVGVGEELPLDPGNPDAAINRRVQLINIGEVR